MSAPLEDDDADAGGRTRRAAQPDPASGCGEIRLESGDLLIYDGRDDAAWIQSNVAVEIAELA